MRIATYNTWNSDAGMPIRFRQLADAIIRERADILCLQEVADRENPRWSVVEAKNTVEVNQRVDWIMLKNPYPAGLPQLKERTFRKKPALPPAIITASRRNWNFKEKRTWIFGKSSIGKRFGCRMLG